MMTPPSYCAVSNPIARQRLEWSFEMPRPVLTAALLLIFFGVSVLGNTRSAEPVKSNVPLSDDEIAIYQVVLQQYVTSKEADRLDVSVRTYPFDPNSHRSGVTADCLRGIELQNLASIAHTFHLLTPNVLTVKNSRLVDPDKQSQIVRENDPDKTMRKGKSVSEAVNEAYSTALFSLSEIAFDKENRHAVVSYSYWCGALCGHGSTLVFERVGNIWKKMDRHCGGWIS